MTDQCKNCLTELKGPFCHECGQKKFELSRLTLSVFLTKFFQYLTSFDFKLFKDLPALIFRPGYLTNEFACGSIRRHISPISLFLWLNVFFFLFGYRHVLPQYKYYAANWYVGGLEEKAAEKMQSLNMPEEVYVETFNRKLENYQRYLFFIIIPIYAFFQFLLFIYQKGNLYIKHLVYSIHFWCFLFIYFAIIPYPISLLNAGYFQLFQTNLFPVYDRMFIWLLILGVFPYNLIAMRKVFGEKWIITGLKAFLTVILVIWVRQYGISATYLMAFWTTP